MSSFNDRPFPPAALICAGLLILMTVGGIGTFQLSKHFAPVPPPDFGMVMQKQSLRFADQGDGLNAFSGHVRVYDAVTGVEYPKLRDNDGFVRAILNGLSFERTKRGVTGEPTFLLEAWSGNRLTLEDPATGARINLGSFGTRNEAVFLRFFDHPGTKS